MVDQNPSYTAQDIIDGYRQNYSSFSYLHIQWERKQEILESWRRYIAVLGKRQREIAAASKKQGQEDAKALASAQKLEGMLKEPRNNVVMTLRQEYWSDRLNFQFRISPNSLSVKPEEPGWKFPTAEPNREILPQQFGDIQILSMTGGPESACRIWNAEKSGVFWTGEVRRSLPDTDYVFFPPLGTDDPKRGIRMHPIDDFFFNKDNGPIRVIRVETVGSVVLYVVDRAQEVPLSADFKVRNGIADFKGDLKQYNSIRAWIDPKRGFLPIKMAWGGWFSYEGKPLGPEDFESIKELRVDRITAIDGGGFYPVSGSMVFFGGDPDGAVRPDLLKDYLSGRISKERKFEYTRIDWNVSQIDAKPQSASLYELNFPENTRYYDQVRTRNYIRGRSENLLDDLVLEPNSPVTAPNRRSRTRFWLVVGNAAVIVVLLAVFIRRRRSAV